MKTKGFTLIELLAVIVILAIIAIIATPIVLNIIKDSKDSATLQSAELYLGAVETAVTKNIMDDPTFRPKTCEIQNDGNLKCDEILVKIEISGEKPTKGKIKLVQGKIEDVELVLNGKIILKNVDGKLIASNNKYMSHTLGAISTTSEKLGVTEVSECVDEGKKCESGTAFALMVNDEEVYKFYVINDDGKEVTLIMNNNVGSNCVWISENDYLEAGGTNYTSYGKNDKGPLTVLKTLYSATEDWTNILEREYLISDDTTSNRYSSFVFISRARIMSHDEILVLKTENNDVIPEYLYEGKSYWLSGTRTNNSGNVKYMNVSSKSVLYQNIPASFGARPVITISK